MKASIIYYSKTGTTKTAAEFIAEGIRKTGDIEVTLFPIDNVNFDYVNSSDLVIMGSPTYMCSISGRMKSWLEENAKNLALRGKLAGVFATEQYIHGGAENTMTILLTHLLVLGTMVYSGGATLGDPVIHLGPVGMSQNIGSYHAVFETYGERMGQRVLELAH